MNNERNAKRARFLLKVFVIRHIIGLALFNYLTFTAFRLEMKDLALGAAVLTLLYTGVVIWMGLRLHKAGRPS